MLFSLPCRHAAMQPARVPICYALPSIFLLLAFMALARLKSLESLRYCAPGEWGKVLGLDRVPEVRTLRAKLHVLSTSGQPEQWSAELCRQWMEADPEATGVFYVDGHVRVYHGAQTKLPRRYVSRQRLCLRGTTDYWVNALDAQPFFVVTKTVDPGLVQVIANDIVPPHRRRFSDSHHKQVPGVAVLFGDRRELLFDPRERGGIAGQFAAGRHQLGLHPRCPEAGEEDDKPADPHGAFDRIFAALLLLDQGLGEKIDANGHGRSEEGRGRPDCDG